MLLLEQLSRLQNSNTSLLFWNLFTGLKFLNELNIRSSLSLTKFSILLSHRICMTSYLFSLFTVTTHALHLMSLWSNHHHHSKSLTAPSDMLHLIFGTSFLHHSGFLIQIIHPPLSDHHSNMPVRRFNFLHTAITFHHFFRLRNDLYCVDWGVKLYSLTHFHHFFTVSLWAQNLPFQKILSSTLVCFCLSDWSHGSRLFTGLICSSVLCFTSIFYVLVIPECGRLSWQLVNF